MSMDAFLTLGKTAMILTLMISAPVLLLGLVVGVVISILQSVTQIQEMTLTFVPKILVTILALIFFGPWMLGILMDFTVRLFSQLPNLAK
jgi:flagellar biosynthetic protein FliQ